MTQETTLAIPRFVELVGVWMGTSGIVVDAELSHHPEKGCFGYVLGRSDHVAVEWNLEGACSGIWTVNHGFNPTEGGLMDALTELAERLRGEK